MYWDADFLNEVFPQATPDKRTTNWFKNRSSTTGDFSLTKYANTFITESVLDIDDSQIVFRYVDGFLLMAEAYAALGETSDAVTNLNIVRSRSGLAAFGGGNADDVKTEVWKERCRELIGEAHYFYDLIRTKYVLDAKKSFGGRTFTTEQFKSGAWTWPIGEIVRANNPKVTYNNYWR